MKQFTKEQAIAFWENELWRELTLDQRAEFQLYQQYLAMPFGLFQEAITHRLGRPVWTHEFASSDELKKEMEDIKAIPSMEEILGLLPQEKLIVVGIDPSDKGDSL